MPNPMVHWELNTEDAAKAQKFYADLLGWSADANNPMNYGLMQSNSGRGADGGIIHSDDAPKGFMLYFEVDDLQAYLDKAVSLGARVVVPMTTIPGMVTFATFADPDGNVAGLVASETPSA